MISIPSAGGYEKLVYQSLPECGYTADANIKLKGIDGSNLVTVDTHACGLNFADVIIRLGLYDSAKEFVGWPITPGFEFSGTITKIGENVKDFKVGDKVMGISLFGGYSQRIQLPGNQILKVPDNITMSEAAGVMVVCLTAYYALFESSKLRKSDTILVHSATGGVGTMIVQMAKNIIGCTVVGVVGSKSKVELAQKIGCDHVIDKSSEDLWTKAKDLTVTGYKAAFDANGIETLQESYNHLCKGGRLICYGSATLLPRSTATSNGALSIMQWVKVAWRAKGSPTFNPLQMLSDNKSLMSFNLSYMLEEKDLIKEAFELILKWISDGTITCKNITEYHLRDIAKAHRDIESGKTTGKLVLLTQEESDKTKLSEKPGPTETESKENVELLKQ